jgi:hypothetical protein
MVPEALLRTMRRPRTIQPDRGIRVTLFALI